MKRARIAAAAALALGLAAPRPAGAMTRDEVAKKFAPIFYQEVRDGRDLFAAFDFDGNWAGDDNGANGTCAADPTQCYPGSACDEDRCPLVGTVYATVIETATHWFVQYMPYHPLDAKTVAGHEHDTESVLVVVAKDGAGGGTVQAYEMLFHTGWLLYADATVKGGAKNPDGPLHLDADGRPRVYMQQVGHGLCGGFSPTDDQFPDLQLECDHLDEPHIAKTGVVYRPDLPAAVPAVASSTTIDAGYTLVEMLTSLWARRAEVGPNKTYQSVRDFLGEGCDVLACPKQYGSPFMSTQDDSPGPPWNQDPGTGVTAIGDQFFDPAFTMTIRLGFPAPFSRDYCHNPYVGITARCAEDPPVPPAPPGGSSGAPPTGPGGGTAGGNGAPAPQAASGGGSGCSASPRAGDPASALALVAALALASRRRRRREG